MDVLDEDDDRPIAGQLLDEPDDGLAHALAHLERVNVARGSNAEHELEPVASGEAPSDLLVIGGLPDSEVLLHDLAQRPVRDPVAVREAAAGPPVRGWLLAGEQLPELPHEPGLPDARLAEEGHEMRLPLGDGPPERRHEQLELRLAPHEDPFEPCSPSRTSQCQRTQDGTTFHPLRLPLGLDAAAISELESSADRGDRPVADENLARLGGLLQAVADVDGVTRGERAALARRPDDDLPRVDADAHLRGAFEEPVQAPLHGESRMERALRMILERQRGAEHGHHRVSCELLDRAARAFDLLLHRVVEALEPSAHALGVAVARERRRPDQVAEEDRHELPLLARTHGRSLPERRRAG